MNTEFYWFYKDDLGIIQEVGLPAGTMYNQARPADYNYSGWEQDSQGEATDYTFTGKEKDNTGLRNF